VEIIGSYLILSAIFIVGGFYDVAMTPGKQTCYIYEPGAWLIGDHSNPCAIACGLNYGQGYNPIFKKQLDNPGTAPKCSLSIFKRELESRKYGVIWIHSHGSLPVEYYEHTDAGYNAVWNSYHNYLDQGYSQDHIVVCEGYYHDHYAICVYEAGVNAWFKQTSCLDSSLVFYKGCGSADYCDDWGALVALGYAGDISGLAGCDTFWARMNGKKNLDDRYVGGAIRDPDFDLWEKYELYAVGNMATTLAPAIFSHRFYNNERWGYVNFNPAC
jgi:hypothetical protein